MTFSGHVAVSLIAAKFIHNPAELVAINVIAHPILDMIPHAEWSTFRESKTKAILITVVDFMVGLSLIGVALSVVPRDERLILLSIIAGLWIDWLDLLAGRWWKRLRYFHESFHTWPASPKDPVDWSKTVTGRTPTWVKLLVQLGLVVICYLLIR